MNAKIEVQIRVISYSRAEQYHQTVQQFLAGLGGRDTISLHAENGKSGVGWYNVW